MGSGRRRCEERPIGAVLKRFEPRTPRKTRTRQAADSGDGRSTGLLACQENRRGASCVAACSCFSCGSWTIPWDRPARRRLVRLEAQRERCKRIFLGLLAEHHVVALDLAVDIADRALPGAA